MTGRPGVDDLLITTVDTESGWPDSLLCDGQRLLV